MVTTILIIDDERPLRHALVETFTRNGFEVSQAPDGQAGLDQALAEHPDIMLVDITMPKMNGLEMLAKLRQDKWGSTAKVIMLTNQDDFTNVQTAMRLRVFTVLVKSSWSLEEIVSKVKQELLA